ncbi:MAG: MBL fold metallo-hydrolase [Candidatus Bathyarchaeia archaeon]
MDRLAEAEKVEIISLMDNSIDMLSTINRTEVKTFKEWMKKPLKLPIAEHGFSMLVRVWTKGEKHVVLFDTGISPLGIIINARRMGINLSEVETIVLSHGHYDHFGGLSAVIKAIKRENLPIIVHEDMFKTRGSEADNGTIRRYPAFPSDCEVKPAKYVKTREPYLIAGGSILVTGEIPRETKFEKGYSRHRALINGEWVPDPWIWDDRALVIKHIKGLIIISGCAHAGIINTINYARRVTGVNKVYAVMGGFHLAGKEDEKRIGITVEEFKCIKPEIIVPCHCTGWRGILAIFEAMPDAFIWNSVGNLYQL